MLEILSRLHYTRPSFSLWGFFLVRERERERERLGPYPEANVEPDAVAACSRSHHPRLFPRLSLL